jgi:hypothetical protein
MWEKYMYASCAFDITVGPLAYDICFVIKSFLLTSFIRHLPNILESNPHLFFVSEG